MTHAYIPRPLIAEFSGSALIHNARIARARVPQDGQVYAVIKADAYGHGLLEVAHRLEQAAVVDGFAILELAAAQALRDQGCRLPLVLLEGFFDEAELTLMRALDVCPVIHRKDQIASLRQHAPDIPLTLFVKVNTGMNRLGFMPSEAKGVVDDLQALPSVRCVGVMTHFADADNARGTQWQIDRLRTAWPEVMAQQLSLANSAALLAGPPERRCLGDIARPGIMLYGASPWGNRLPDAAQSFDLRPVMTLKSEIIAIQKIAEGETVGYGGAFTSDRPMMIGVVACGYADGYPRHAPTGTPILVDGVRTQTVGRVSMDMLCCDLSTVPSAKIHSSVVLWGDGLPADDVAAASGTIAYELFCALAARVPRRWKD